MDAPRFFAPDATTAGVIVPLPAEEGVHLTRVLRLSSGDRVRVFDGRGHEWAALVYAAGKDGVRVQLEQPLTPAREARVPLTLAMAVLKGDKMDDIVRDAVMLGVSAIQPVVTARTETSAASIAKRARIARWQRIAVASAKQCGRAVVPPVGAACSLPAALQTADPTIMFVEPDAETRRRGLCEVVGVERAAVLIGPEGGWTADELRLAANSGAQLVTLGTPTLRADAMPLVALTALRVHLGDL